MRNSVGQVISCFNLSTYIEPSEITKTLTTFKVTYPIKRCVIYVNWLNCGVIDMIPNIWFLVFFMKCNNFSSFKTLIFDLVYDKSRPPILYLYSFLFSNRYWTWISSRISYNLYSFLLFYHSISSGLDKLMFGL